MTENKSLIDSSIFTSSTVSVAGSPPIEINPTLLNDLVPLKESYYENQPQLLWLNSFVSKQDKFGGVGRTIRIGESNLILNSNNKIKVLICKIKLISFNRFN